MEDAAGPSNAQDWDEDEELLAMQHDDLVRVLPPYITWGRSHCCHVP